MNMEVTWDGIIPFCGGIVAGLMIALLCAMWFEPIGFDLYVNKLAPTEVDEILLNFMCGV